MWRLVVLCALVIFVAAGCGGSSETPLQQTSIPQPKEEVNLITQTPAQAADETNDAPVCRGEQAVPRGLLDRIETALEEANSNIEEANSNIEDAQGYAWSNYQEMGEALENLTTVDTVAEP